MVETENDKQKREAKDKMTRNKTTIGAIILYLVAITALYVPAGAQAQTNTPDSKPKVFKLTGVVKSVDDKNRKLVVQHGDIPGFMSAMTMPYKVGKSEDLKKVSPGDKIQADVVVSNGGADLENIKVNAGDK
jgi:Cu/Ag efflux protein CusF